ncbi:hypothetical protein [Thalassotalea atypica]|uniref:hypothetical protein n=1 Tax=Thalassotalea atypica TaxID=2054316 RepID=UPI002573ADF3|nr:hypothetical protein [Thalassotalea atypica]
MSITIGSTDSVQTNTETAQGVLTAKKAQGQQELEGKMALDLIQSATAAITQPVPAPTGNAGHTINIKV